MGGQADLGQGWISSSRQAPRSQQPTYSYGGHFCRYTPALLLSMSSFTCPSRSGNFSAWGRSVSASDGRPSRPPTTRVLFYSCGMRKRSGRLPSQAGVRPHPDQVLPVLGSMYFGGSGAFSEAAEAVPAGRPRRCRPRPQLCAPLRFWLPTLAFAPGVPDTLPFFCAAPSPDQFVLGAAVCEKRLQFETAEFTRHLARAQIGALPALYLVRLPSSGPSPIRQAKANSKPRINHNLRLRTRAPAGLANRRKLHRNQTSPLL